MEIREFVAADGDSPFGAWFDTPDAQSAARIAVALTRMEAGNSQMQGRLAAAFLSSGSMLVPVIASISAAKAMPDHIARWRHKTAPAARHQGRAVAWSEYKGLN
jgi:hypothetical protein